MSLAKKISELLSTTPGSYDPEEEDAPKVVERDPEDLEDEVETSNYRRRNVDLLEDVDVKYAGKKSSRRGLTQDSDDDDDGNVSNENDEVTSSDGDADGSAESEAGSDDSREPSLTRGEEEEDNIVHVRDSNTSNEAKKGACVRNQLGIWENLLEIRIQLQKCLLTANGMPRAATFNDIKTQSGEAFTGKVAETRKNVAGAFDKLLHLQELLLKQYPETKASDDDDEEIPSDSGDGGEAEPEEEEEGPEKPRKRRKLAHYEKTIALNHEKYRTYRNSVIQKWHDKTRIGMATAKSGAAHSVLEQIEYHLAETKEKLRRRTQVKRSEYEIVGKAQVVDDEEYDPEVFDDGDFYHQLLRELIEVKSADVTDPVKLGQQWIRLQGLRSKMKRKIDTRATKGRKVRYAVHAKLVNFMAPIDEGGAAWTDEAAKTELFGSLFGKSRSALHVV